MAPFALLKRSPVFILMSFAALACTSPDPMGTVDEFETRRAANAEERRQNMPDAGGDEPAGCTARADINGVFLLAVDTSVAPGSPMFFESTVVYDDSVDPPTMAMTMKPLTAAAFAPPGFEVIEPPYEVLGMTYEATAVGPVPVAEDGTFELDFGTTNVVGDANPITGRDIQATLTVSGEIRSADAVCGAVNGDLIAPFAAPLAGSNMGMVRVSDGDFAGATALLKCPPCGGEMDEGMGGAMDDGEG